MTQMAGMFDLQHLSRGGRGLAAALSGGAGTGRICCVVSGGNIDTHVLTSILRGEALEPA